MYYVCVIGAGNAAMNVARTVLRNGSSDVHIMYRRGENSMDAEDAEIEYAKADGVQFDLYKAPIEIVDADSVIIAIGQKPRTNIVANTKGFEVHKNGLVVTDECGRTTRVSGKEL